MSISLDIKKEAENCGISVESLAVERIQALKEECMRKYVEGKREWFLWNGLKDTSALSDSTGWEMLPDFIQDKSCLMFFENEDKDMLAIKNGKDLYILLAEMYGFEFYITDYETSFLLCFNHHNILYGCGTAKPWVESLKGLSADEYRNLLNLIRNTNMDSRQILPVLDEEEPFLGRRGISLEVKKKAQTLGISVKSIKAEGIRTLKEGCMEQYVENKETEFLWERLKNPSVLINSKARILISDFIQSQNEACYLFFDEDDDMLMIENGRDFLTLVSEMPDLEFYITDFYIEYVLCFRCPDCILGCGLAEYWIDHMRSLELEQSFQEYEGGRK